jgi:ABC-2 type transport system ATP-binding protein
VVIIANGRIRQVTPLADLYGLADRRLRVRGRDPQRLWQAFESAGGKVTADDDALEVAGLSAEEAGEIAFAEGVPLYELSLNTPNLEQIFLDLAAG